MFGDADWIAARSEAQRARLDWWSAGLKRPVVIEIGAGTGIPTVRRFTERFGANYVRINAREPDTPGRLGIGLEGRGLETLRRIENVIGGASPTERSKEWNRSEAVTGQ